MTGPIIDEIFKCLIDKQEITANDLINIFAKCNSYIVGIDDDNINITQMVHVVNISYKIAKSGFIWKKRVEENQKNISKQLDGVSQAIKKMAKGIETQINKNSEYQTQEIEITELLRQKNILIQDISIKKEGRYFVEIYISGDFDTNKTRSIEKIATQVLKEQIVLNEEACVGKKLSFLSEDKYVMAIAKEETTKNKSEESGDSVLNIRLKDGKYLVALSDGMGTGSRARKSSEHH